MWMHPISLEYWEVMKIRQILFCVESNRKARTDYQYIEATLKRFYKEDKKIRYRPIYMGSKTRYKAKDVVKEIQNNIKACPYDTKVIYFIDVDDYNISAATKKLYDDIKAYCDINGYAFVFFDKDVEDVYLGNSVRDKEKVDKVAEFKRKQRINQVDVSMLEVNDHRRHGSNILRVLDQYWVRR